MFADGFTAQNQAGLGLIVIPAVSMVPLQYFIFRIGEYLFVHYLKNMREKDR